jgi:hypothetical protein
MIFIPVDQFFLGDETIKSAWAFCMFAMMMSILKSGLLLWLKQPSFYLVLLFEP